MRVGGRGTVPMHRAAQYETCVVDAVNPPHHILPPLGADRPGGSSVRVCSEQLLCLELSQQLGAGEAGAGLPRAVLSWVAAPLD